MNLAPAVGRRLAPECKRRVQLNVAPADEDDSLGGPQRKLPICGAATPKRLAAPRLSLLGKPIYLSAHKSHCRNTRSMRLKMRLKAFLEQPQGFLAYLYHSAL